MNANEFALSPSGTAAPHPRLPSLITVVLPACNEVNGIARSVEVVSKVLDTLGPEWEIVIADDGSHDGTFAVVRKLGERDSRIRGVRLSRNFGKEAALLAGLSLARGEVVVTMDADLQHPPELIPEFLRAWQAGAKAVHGVKRSRPSDRFTVRLRASLFNAVLTRLSGISLEHSSDFKLLDRVVVDALLHQLPERRRFFRGLAEWVGYTSVTIPFDVAAREQGETQFSLRRLVSLSIVAIVSFTAAPLRIVTVLGLLTLGFGSLIALDAMVSWMRGLAVSGFVTIIVTLLLLGSFIMISLGIIGEYIAKIYDETKARPPFLIESTSDRAAKAAGPDEGKDLR